LPRPDATFNIINDKKKEGSRILGIIDKTDRYLPPPPPSRTKYEVVTFLQILDSVERNDILLNSLDGESSEEENSQHPSRESMLIQIKKDMNIVLIIFNFVLLRCNFPHK
jgi:hypothetical protein